MAHTILRIDPAYCKLDSGTVKSLGIFQYTTSTYIFNPSTIATAGGNKDSTMSANDLAPMFSNQTPPDLTVASASDFLLSNWTSKGWGSSLEEVENNYEIFIGNNFSSTTLNRGNYDLQSVIVKGSISGQPYFIPVLLFGDGGSTPAFAYIEKSGITYTSKSFGKHGEEIKISQSQGGQGTLRYDEYNASTLASFQSAFPGVDPQFRPSWTTLVGNTTGFRMMMRVDTSSGIAYNTIIGEPGYNDASQSSVPGFISGVTHSFSGYYDTDFAQLGFEATSTNEIGMGAGLDGKSGETISSIKVTFENYNKKYSNYSGDARSFISPAGFTIPVTLRIYSLSASGSEVGRLLGEVTQDKLMLWIPEEKNDKGIAFNVTFDISSLGIKVPSSEKVVVTVAYNTNNRGYSPIGAAGPYDSLGIGMMEKIYDSGNGNVTYGTSAGSLVSDNGLYWCNSLPVGSQIGHIDQCKNKSLSVIRTGLTNRDFRVILATNSSGTITSTNSQVATSLNSAAPTVISVTGNASTATVFTGSDFIYFKKEPVFQTNASVYADGRPGVVDPSSRPGWYFKNSTAGQKINWYFYDGLNFANLNLSQFSAFAVVTFDTSKTLLGFFTVYTVPTGSGDSMPGFAKSRVVYTPSVAPVIGTKYLVYFGQNPPIYLDLPRIQLSKSIPASSGPQGAGERVYTCSWMTDSGAGVNTVQFVTERLGVYSSTFKMDSELKIK